MVSFPEKDDLRMAVDIGTKTVKAILFKKEREGIRILNRAISNYPVKIEPEEKCLKWTIERAISEVKLQKHKLPKKIIIGIGEVFGPKGCFESRGITKKYILKRKYPSQKITEKEFKEIIKITQEQSINSVAKEFPPSKVSNLRIFKASVEEIKIDDCQVANPIGFLGEKVKFSIFTSFIFKGDFENLKIIFRDLDLELQNLVYEPYALLRCLDSNLPTSQADMIFLDIGGDFTQVSFIREGMFLKTKPFSIGGDDFTRHLSRFGNIEVEKAEKIKIAYSQGLIQPPLVFKIHNILEKDFKTWLEGIEIILNDFYKNQPFPSLVYIFGGGSEIPEIKSIFQDSREMDKIWEKRFLPPPQIERLKPKNITNIINKFKLQSSQDVVPLSLCSYTSI